MTSEYEQKYDQYLKAVNVYNTKLHEFYTGSDTSERIIKYNTNCKNYADSVNPSIPKKNYPKEEKRRIRIMSWNVRYWTDSNNKQQITDQIMLMMEQDPDIICLQEATWGAHEKYTDHVDYNNYNDAYNKLLERYEIVGFCSATPSWYASSYGNMILISKEFSHLCIVNKDKFASSEFLCDTLKGKCFFNQMVRNYDDVPEKQISVRTGQSIQYTDITNEVKCFIKISLFNFDIVCVHLDAYKVDYRLGQIKQIKDNITRPTIIVGDFNFFYTKDYAKLKRSDAIEELAYHVDYREKRGGDKKDMDREYDEITSKVCVGIKEKHCPDHSWTEINKIMDTPDANAPIFTQWSGTRVDFSFVSNIAKGTSNKEYRFTDACSKSGKFIFNFYLYYFGTNLSDHLPMIVDVDDYAFFNGIKENIGKSSSNGKKQTLTFKSSSFVDELVFNNQPLDGYDWLRLGKGTSDNMFMFNKADDPFLTGNSNMALGNFGVYVTNHASAAFNFGSLIKKNMTFPKNDIGMLKKNVSILFCFRQKEIKNLRSGFLSTVNSGDINYYPSLADDNHCYTYVGQSSGMGTIISKYTRRSLSSTIDTFFIEVDKVVDMLKETEKLIKKCKSINIDDNLKDLKKQIEGTDDNVMKEMSKALETSDVTETLTKLDLYVTKRIESEEDKYKHNITNYVLDRTDIIEPLYYYVVGNVIEPNDVTMFVKLFNEYEKTKELSDICSNVIKKYGSINLITTKVSANCESDNAYTGEDLIMANIYVILKAIDLINKEASKIGYKIKIKEESFIPNIENLSEDDDDFDRHFTFAYTVSLVNIDPNDTQTHVGGGMYEIYRNIYKSTKSDYLELIRNRL